jgi:hypothetical protein
MRATRLRLGQRNLLCLLALTLLGLGGCTHHDSPFVLGIHHLKGSNAAATRGTLTLRNSCVMLRFSRGFPPEMLAWPEGFTVEAAQGGGFRVLDDQGQTVGTGGKHIKLGGGPIGPTAVRTASGDSLPSKCATSDVWAVDRRSVP